MPRLAAEVAGVGVEDPGAALDSRAAREVARVVSLDEAHEHPRLAAGRGVVKRHAARPGVADREPRESVVAPEGTVVDGVDLDHRPHREALGELGAQGRQRGVEVDAGRQRRGDRHDRALRGDDRAVGVNDHRPPALDDPADRRAQDHPVLAECARDLDRHLLRASDEAALLVAGRCAEEVLERVRRGDVEEDVEQRQVAWLARQDGLRAEVDELLAIVGREVGLLPALEGLPVVLGGIRRSPRRVRPDLLGHAVELDDRRSDVDEARTWW